MKRWIAGGLLAVMLTGLGSSLAMAGSGGRKNTAIALTGGAVYTWLNGGFKSAGRRNTAIGLTAASVVGWHRYNKARQAERRRANLARSYQPSYASQVRGYRSYVRPASNSGGTASGSNRYCQDSYRAGYRAGYQAGSGASA